MKRDSSGPAGVQMVGASGELASNEPYDNLTITYDQPSASHLYIGDHEGGADAAVPPKYAYERTVQHTHRAPHQLGAPWSR